VRLEGLGQLKNPIISSNRTQNLVFVRIKYLRWIPGKVDKVRLFGHPCVVFALCWLHCNNRFAEETNRRPAADTAHLVTLVRATRRIWTPPRPPQPPPDPSALARESRDVSSPCASTFCYQLRITADDVNLLGSSIPERETQKLC
jgi:hypothetical protein